MKFRSQALRFATAAPGLLLWPALQGCTQAPAASEAPAPAPAIGMRLLVKAGAQTDGLAGEALARRAGEIARLPVRHLSAQGGGWHALALGCAEQASCDAGMQRLRASGTEFPVVELDGRASRGPSQPRPESGR